MRCPSCGHADTRVIDVDQNDIGVRRRRECYNAECNARFSTYEIECEPRREKVVAVPKNLYIPQAR